MSEIPVHSRPRRLADWINPTGAKKVHSLMDKVYQRKNLEMAWEMVKANRGSGGVDGQSLDGFAAQLDQQLDRLQSELTEDVYRPQPVRQVQIPKAGKPGEFRTLGIPTVSDRIAQTVVKSRLEPVVDPLFHPDSYGYRPGKSGLDAVGQARKRCWRYDWILDLDIKGFFDNIPQDLLIRAVKKHAKEQWIVLYIERWLKAPVQGEDGQLVPRGKGTPQGGVITPLTQKVISNLRGYCRGGGLFVRSLTCAVKGNMFMADGPVDQSRQISTAECSLRNAAAQCCLVRGHAALIPTVRPVRTSGIPLPGRSDPSRPTGRSFGSCGTDHAQAACGNGSPSASLCQKQRPDNRSDRDARFGGVSRYSEKAWLSCANPTARFKFRLNMHLIACTMRSSVRPTVFWCPFGSVPLAGV